MKGATSKLTLRLSIDWRHLIAAHEKDPETPWGISGSSIVDSMNRVIQSSWWLPLSNPPVDLGGATSTASTDTTHRITSFRIVDPDAVPHLAKTDDSRDSSPSHCVGATYVRIVAWKPIRENPISREGHLRIVGLRSNRRPHRNSGNSRVIRPA